MNSVGQQWQPVLAPDVITQIQEEPIVHRNLYSKDLKKGERGKDKNLIFSGASCAAKFDFSARHSVEPSENKSKKVNFNHANSDKRLMVLTIEGKNETEDIDNSQADMMAEKKGDIVNRDGDEKECASLPYKMKNQKGAATITSVDIIVTENKKAVQAYKDSKGTGISKDQIDKKDIDTSSPDTMARTILKTHDRRNVGSEKKVSYPDEIMVEPQDTQRHSHGNDIVGNDSKQEEQKCLKTENALETTEILDSKPPSSLTVNPNVASMEAKSQVVQKKNNDEPRSYPLDGHWEMTWKSCPANNTTFVVRDHIFQMFDCPCEIVLTGSEDDYSPIIQWPITITSDENPVFQQTELTIPPGKTCEVWPASIVWTTSDQQYGEITWTRLNSDGTKPGRLVVKNQNDASSLYPLDGVWKLSWKSFPAESGAFVVEKHEFKLFDYPCKIIMGDLQDNHCPRFQWPEAVTTVKNLVFQESQVSIPPGTGSTECPNSIVWTTTDKGYGEITWTKLSSTACEEMGDCERKRKHLPYSESYASRVKRRELEKFQMESSIPGKAWTFVENVLTMQTGDICAIAKDDIVYLTERMLRAQMDFKNRKLPHHVDIAYHHTRSENLDTIKTDGLLSRTERERHNIYSNFNGSAYGDGIYCSWNPRKFAIGRYGDTTILFARMKGVETRQSRTYRWNNPNPNHDFIDDYNTLVMSSQQFCVLRSCSQCVPLFQFRQALLGSNSSEEKGGFLEKLATFQKEVQILLDKIFNENKSTEVDTSWSHRSPTQRYRNFPNTQQSRIQSINNHPIILKPQQILPTNQEIISYVAPERIDNADDWDFCKPVLTYNLLASDCSICSRPLKRYGKVVQIAKCGHLFHSACIEKKRANQSPCCPVCLIPITRKHLRGTMPSGSMIISHDKSACEGFEESGTIVIHYKIPCGIQKQYHPNPGDQFGSIDIKAYLPDTQPGRLLLKRLRFAFSRGLTLRVTNTNAVICFISHKTNQRSSTAFYGNPNSYPDPAFISNCNYELNTLQIPFAAAIKYSGIR